MNHQEQAIYPRNTWYVAATAAEVTDKPRL